MTSMSPLFTSYNPCSGKEKVRLANGSLSPVLGSSVFHVPDFAVNLLSIARITLELNCRIIFYSYYCFFQDLVMGQMIGSGSLRDGLYYLDSQPNTQVRLIQAYYSVQADDCT